MVDPVSVASAIAVGVSAVARAGSACNKHRTNHPKKKKSGRVDKYIETHDNPPAQSSYYNYAQQPSVPDYAYYNYAQQPSTYRPPSFYAQEQVTLEIVQSRNGVATTITHSSSNNRYASF